MFRTPSILSADDGRGRFWSISPQTKQSFLLTCACPPSADGQLDKTGSFVHLTSLLTQEDESRVVKRKQMRATVSWTNAVCSSQKRAHRLLTVGSPLDLKDSSKSSQTSDGLFPSTVLFFIRLNGHPAFSAPQTAGVLHCEPPLVAIARD